MAPHFGTYHWNKNTVQGCQNTVQDCKMAFGTPYLVTSIGVALMSCNSNISDMPSEKGTLVIDTGASNHICNDFTLLADINHVDPPLPVFLPDRSTHLVHKTYFSSMFSTFPTSNSIFCRFITSACQLMFPSSLLHLFALCRTRRLKKSWVWARSVVLYMSLIKPSLQTTLVL